MNICLVTPAFPQNEEDYRAAFSLDFARALQRRGHTVVVHTPQKTGGAEDLGIPVERFGWAGGHKAIARTRFWHPRDIYELMSLRRNGPATLLECVERCAIDACFALWTIPSGEFAFEVKKRTGVPYSVWALGSDIWTYGRVPYFKQMIRRVCAHADRAFADGFELAKMVESISGRECVFLPSARALPETGGTERTPRDGKTRFLFVGRFDTVKGVASLIEAAAVLGRKRDDFMVEIRGEGPLEERLRSLARGQDAIVAIGGRVSRREFAEALARSDALVIPSTMESIPVVMTDALQKGVPVLVSDVGDMGYLVRTYGVGDLFIPGDVTGIAACLDRFMSGAHSYSGNIPKLTAEINIDRAADIYLESFNPAH
jgi:glycosyltransferase involved in cell wall biosynthesis